MGSPSSTGTQATDSYTNSVRTWNELPFPSVEFDGSAYGQSLASVLNNPRLGKAGIHSSDSSWGSWLFQGSNDVFIDEAPPPLPAGILPDVVKADFRPYLDKISEHYTRFVDVRQHSGREQSSQTGVAAANGSGDAEFEGRVGQGEALEACLQEIPSLYFDEDFALEKGSTFDAACPFYSIPQNMLLLEKLSHYLDLVEEHLVREICAKSDSFFDALGQLEDLNAQIVQASDQIQGLHSTVKLLDGDLVESASRLGYSIDFRGTLQSQSKSFVDNQHASRMTKITAALEQETWVAVDVPDEFQAIVDSFIAVEDVSNGGLGSGDATLEEGGILDQLEKTQLGASGEEVAFSTVETSSQTRGLVRLESIDEAEKKTEGNEAIQALPSSPNVLGDSMNDESQSATRTRHEPEIVSPILGIQPKPFVQVTPHGSGGLGGDVTVKPRKTREKPSLRTLHVRGQSYHAVNCGLILLRMIKEYMDISNALPTLATEVVHCVAQVLRLYNSRSFQLVLGAGAMQVSGLKSITPRHLALASQSISFFYSIMPDIQRILSGHIPEAQKGLLLVEIDLVGQDYRVHRDEIHSKLVQIMEGRLLVHLKAVPQNVESWNKLVPDNDNQPSQWAHALVNEVGVLHRILSPLLLEKDVRSIFTRVVALFHTRISDVFSKLDVYTPQGKRRMFRDIQHILGCTRGLPSDDVEADGMQKPGELDEFLMQRYGMTFPFD